MASALVERSPEAAAPTVAYDKAADAFIVSNVADFRDVAMSSPVQGFQATIRPHGTNGASIRIDRAKLNADGVVHQLSVTHRGEEIINFTLAQESFAAQMTGGGPALLEDAPPLMLEDAPYTDPIATLKFEHGTRSFVLSDVENQEDLYIDTEMDYTPMHRINLAVAENMHRCHVSPLAHQ
eukprot:326987_1